MPKSADNMGIPQLSPRTEVNDVHALASKRLHALAARSDVSVVGIVDDDLAALDGEKVPDLVLEFVFNLCT
jgi:hypothetical protein